VVLVMFVTFVLINAESKERVIFEREAGMTGVL